MDVSDIFYFFSSGERKGESGAREREGGRFFFGKSQEGGGGPRRRWEGARGPGGCLQGIFWGGGGGLNSGTCKRGRQKGVSLICSDLF